MTTFRAHLKTLAQMVVLLAITAFVLAPPAVAQFTLKPPVTNSFHVACTNSVAIAQASAATTELVALTAGQNIYVCGFVVTQLGAAGPPTFKFVRGTGTNCGTGTADLTGVFNGSATAGAITTVAYGSGLGAVIVGAAGNALCITSTTTSPQAGVLTYAKF